jgi:hypothetical protein
MAKSKARRLVLMYRLRVAGVLEQLTLRQIGKITGVTRATVLRNLQELDAAEASSGRSWRQSRGSNASRLTSDFFGTRTRRSKPSSG